VIDDDWPFIPASAMTFPNRADSLRMQSRNCSGVPPVGSTPFAANFSFMSAAVTTLLSSASDQDPLSAERQNGFRRTPERGLFRLHATTEGKEVSEGNHR
jgi:hypothetical protein